VEKKKLAKLRIIKCPQCVCNDSIINLKDYHITFYDCKYSHKNRIYLLDQYDESQNINFSKISCSRCGFKTTMDNCDSFDDFYKCLTCSKKLKKTHYFCSKHKIEHDETHKKHIKVRYDDKNYYCEEHFDKFIEYCFLCNKNLCQECSKIHAGEKHIVQSYESLTPNLAEIKRDLNTIKQKINDLVIFIDNIKNSLDGAFEMYNNYYKIANDITEKYELYIKDLKNYRILRNFLNLKISNNQIIKDLDEIFDNNDLGFQCNKLINTYQEDRGKYNKTQEMNLEKHGIEDYKEWKEQNVLKEENKKQKKKKEHKG